MLHLTPRQRHGNRPGRARRGEDRSKHGSIWRRVTVAYRLGAGAINDRHLRIVALERLSRSRRVLWLLHH